MSTTIRPDDIDLKRGVDSTPVEQNKKYLVLSDDELAKGFIRPFRDAYVHRSCGFTTVMGRKIAETYARNPKFYGATYCTACQMHRPVGEFYWEKQFHTDLEVTLGD